MPKLKIIGCWGLGWLHLIIFNYLGLGLVFLGHLQASYSTGARMPKELAEYLTTGEPVVVLNRSNLPPVDSALPKPPSRDVGAVVPGANVPAFNGLSNNDILDSMKLVLAGIPLDQLSQLQATVKDLQISKEILHQRVGDLNLNLSGFQQKFNDAMMAQRQLRVALDARQANENQLRNMQNWIIEIGQRSGLLASSVLGNFKLELTKAQEVQSQQLDYVKSLKRRVSFIKESFADQVKLVQKSLDVQSKLQQSIIKKQQTALDASEQALQDMQKRLRAVMPKIAATTTSLQVSARLKTLQGLVNALNNAYAQLQSQIDSLKNELSRAQATKVQADLQHQKHLEAKNAELQKRQKDFVVQLKSLQKEVRRVVELARPAGSSFAKTTNTIGQLKQAFTTLIQLMAIQVKQLDQQQKQINIHQDAITSLTSVTSNQGQQMSMVESIREAGQKDLLARVMDLMGVKAGLTAQIQQALSGVALFKNNISKLNASIGYQLTEFNKKIAALESDKGVSDKKVQDLVSLLNTSQKMVARKQDIESQMLALQNNFVAQQREILNKSNEFSQLKLNLQPFLSSMGQALNGLKGNVAGLYSSLSVLDKLKKQNIDLTAQLADSNQIYQQYLSGLAQSKLSLAPLSGPLGELQNKMKQHRLDQGDLFKGIDQLITNNRQLQLDNSSLQAQLGSLKAENAVLKSQLADNDGWETKYNNLLAHYMALLDHANKSDSELKAILQQG